MNDTKKQILELLSLRGKSASEMTHALKFLGDGSMEAGLSRISEYFSKESKIATAKGALGATVVIALIALVKKKIDETRKHNEEGEAILKGLEDGLADYTKNDEKTVTAEQETKDESN